MTDKRQADMLLWLSDARGIYIPRDFANSFANRDRDVSGVSAEDWAVLEAGPDHEFYWDVWNSVCDDARITDSKAGITYFVYQEGDCWLVPEGSEWDEKLGTFVVPNTDTDE